MAMDPGLACVMIIFYIFFYACLKIYVNTHSEEESPGLMECLWILWNFEILLFKSHFNFFGIGGINWNVNRSNS